MKNKALISILEQLKADDELCVEISECISGEFLDLTYAIGYELNEYGQLVLKMDVEKDKFTEISIT